MGLVDYPDSDEESPETAKGLDAIRNPAELTNDNKKNLPPLPSSFHNLYSTATRASTSDDPGLHGGRKRLTPHIEGHWPTHVYIEWIPKPEEAAALGCIVETFQPRSIRNHAGPHEAPFLHSLVQSELGVSLPLHISLSRSLSLQTAQRDDFKARLQAAVRSSGVKAFNVSFKNMKQVGNFEGTRHFLVLSLECPPRNELNRLLKACNLVCSSFGFPELYVTTNPTKLADDPVSDASEAFHFSIAWSLAVDNVGVSGNSAMMKQFEALRSSVAVACCSVKLKIGNEVCDLRLNP